MARQTKRARRVRTGARRARNRAAAAAAPLTLNQLRVIVCGAVFVALVGLKLLLPGSLAAVRGTLGTWLARDTDFVSAFSAVGRAVSGEGGALDALGDAYAAVFGEAEAVEVVSAAPPVETRGYPEHAAVEQRVLGFDYAAPLAGEITSPFGWREHPADGREAFHYGVDVAADEGAEIACFADGTVGVVGESVELGKYLTVHHENGVMTLYAHCSRVTVSSGDAVARGDKLAEAGSTGNATGPHLHFEIHDGEDYLNPEYYLS
ncbi:MAG: M23 family metallopeptidase [Oscillospiraceae bacterium]|nr:M23 family metallopeptidase [Oscillospiraceae bacterium]